MIIIILNCLSNPDENTVNFQVPNMFHFFIYVNIYLFSIALHMSVRLHVYIHNFMVTVNSLISLEISSQGFMVVPDTVTSYLMEKVGPGRRKDSRDEKDTMCDMYNMLTAHCNS